MVGAGLQAGGGGSPGLPVGWHTRQHLALLHSGTLAGGGWGSGLPLSCRPTPTTARKSTAASTCTASWPTSRGSLPSTTSGSCRPGPSLTPGRRRFCAACWASSPCWADPSGRRGSGGAGRGWGKLQSGKRDLFKKINTRKTCSSEPAMPAFTGAPADCCPQLTEKGGVASVSSHAPSPPHLLGSPHPGWALQEAHLLSSLQPKGFQCPLLERRQGQPVCLF